MQKLHGCKFWEGCWTAGLDTMPPEKPRMTVKGVCTCPTSGFKTSLRKANPQGINPDILLLDLVTDPPTNIVNQVVTNYDVTYHEKDSQRYTEVTILPCNITVSVKVVS